MKQKGHVIAERENYIMKKNLIWVKSRIELKCLLLSFIFTTILATTVFASENDILDAILAEEAAKQELWEERVEEIEGDGICGDRNKLLRTQITCYIEPGKRTSTGDKRMDGIIAASREYVGRVAQVYYVAEDGGIGDFIGYYEVADTGYGAPTGYGKSYYKNRKSAGSIELGLTVDFRKPNMKAARGFMLDTYTGGGTTGSEVWLTLEDGEG